MTTETYHHVIVECWIKKNVLYCHNCHYTLKYNSHTPSESMYTVILLVLPSVSACLYPTQYLYYDAVYDILVKLLIMWCFKILVSVLVSNPSSFVYHIYLLGYSMIVCWKFWIYWSVSSGTVYWHAWYHLLMFSSSEYLTLKLVIFLPTSSCHWY